MITKETTVFLISRCLSRGSKSPSTAFPNKKTYKCGKKYQIIHQSQATAARLENNNQKANHSSGIWLPISKCDQVPQVF